MSDAAAGAALVVEQVLLYDASLLTIGRKRVAAAEFLINESLYPNINGSHRGTAIAKEADAVCYLFADAVQLEEAGKERVVGQRRQSTEVECAAGSLSGSVLDVTGAVAQTISCAPERPQSCCGVGKRKTSSPSALSGSPQHRARCSTAVRMAGMLLRWEIRKVMSISHGS